MVPVPLTSSTSLNPTIVGALRNAACAMVVLVHTNYYARPDANDWWPCGMYSVPLFSLPVPVFFLLGGFFAVGHRPGSGGNEVILALWRRLRRLVSPFLFWNGVTLLMLWWQGAATPAHSAVDFFTGVWHLWFVFVLMQFEIVAALLIRFLQPRYLDWFLALSALLSASAYASSDLLLYSGVQATPEYLLRKVVAVWLIFFALGAWLRWRAGALAWLQEHLRWPAFAAVGAYAFYLGEIRYEGDRFGDHPSLQLLACGLPFQVVGSLFVVLALQRVRPGAGAPSVLTMLARGSRHTFAIYLMHASFLILLYRIVWVLGISVAFWPLAPLLAIGTWSLSRITAGLLAHGLPRLTSGLVLGIATATAKARLRP